LIDVFERDEWLLAAEQRLMRGRGKHAVARGAACAAEVVRDDALAGETDQRVRSRE